MARGLISLEATIANALVASGKVVLAVSGGADSVALLLAAKNI